MRPVPVVPLAVSAGRAAASACRAARARAGARLTWAVAVVSATSLAIATLVACASARPALGPAPDYEAPPAPSWLDAGPGAAAADASMSASDGRP